jgi:hypothetical protein
VKRPGANAQSFAIALAAALGITSFAGCPDDEQTGNTSGDPGGTTSGGEGGSGTLTCGDLGEAFTLDEACQECGVSTCCSELGACDEDPACVERFGCRFACSDETCRTTCDTDHPGGGEAASALEACLGGCSAECPAPSSICSAPLSSGDADCDECLSGACCTQVDACLASANCEACLVTGDGTDCDLDPLLTDVTDCFADSCSTVCDG